MRQVNKIIWYFLATVTFTVTLSQCTSNKSEIPTDIETIIEEHPDSALTLLGQINIADNTHKREIALHDLLLSYARYKNYIDDTDDDRIISAALFFENEKEPKYASLGYFLSGMTEMNSGRLGKAAVSFHRGIDIASKAGISYWEGQCARGLFLLYGEILDGSAQLKYARQAYEAFSKEEKNDWADYSYYDLGVAYNNNRQPKLTLGITKDLLEERKLQDPHLMALTYNLAGNACFQLGRHRESLSYYSEAISLLPESLTDDNKYLIISMINNLPEDSIPYLLRNYSDSINEWINNNPPFDILAQKGNYEQAYYNLVRYKNRQDSVLSVILENNVSESLANYAIVKEASERLKKKYERTAIMLAILAVASLIAFWFKSIKFRIQKKEIENEKLATAIESLKADLSAQCEKNRELTDIVNAAAREKMEKDVARPDTGNYEEIIKKKYAEANILCDTYYQNRHLKTQNKEIVSDVKKLIQSFTSARFLKEVEKFVNKESDDLYMSYKKDFSDESDENRRLFLYLFIGFSPRTISVLLDMDISSIYNRKSRLKAKISKCNIERKEEYLRILKR